MPANKPKKPISRLSICFILFLERPNERNKATSRRRSSINRFKQAIKTSIPEKPTNAASTVTILTRTFIKRFTSSKIRSTSIKTVLENC